MSTLIKDLVNVRPAPTLARESAATAVKLILIGALLWALMTFSDLRQGPLWLIGALLLAWYVARWFFVLSRRPAGR